MLSILRLTQTSSSIQHKPKATPITRTPLNITIHYTSSYFFAYDHYNTSNTDFFSPLPKTQSNFYHLHPLDNPLVKTQHLQRIPLILLT